HARLRQELPVRRRDHDRRLFRRRHGVAGRRDRMRHQQVSERRPLVRQDEGAAELGEGKRGLLRLCPIAEGQGIRHGVAMIKGLHHNAYRCRDSEETRRFYEDFLGLPLASTLDISETKTGRVTHVLHTFYQMDDGSFLAFFEAPDMPFDFKTQHDFDLHIALEVHQKSLREMFDKGKARGIDTRGIVDHGFINSIYFRDPNGYVIELTAKTERHAAETDRKS